MRKRIVLVSLCIMIAAAVAACTKKEADSTGAAGGASSQSGSGTISQQQPSQPAAPEQAQNAGGAAQEQQSTHQDTMAQDVSGNTVEQETVGADQTYDARTQSGQEENYSDDQFNEMNPDNASYEEAVNSGWDGTYNSVSGEKLVLTQKDDETLQFSFGKSGISGEAELKDNQAVYHGDDQHVIVFDFAQDTIEVSVLSEEDMDASESPLIGTYTREE